MIDAPLHVLYLRQLTLLREKSIKLYKTIASKADGNEGDAVVQVIMMRRIQVFFNYNRFFSYIKYIF
jgi:hypothetical protein